MKSVKILKDEQKIAFLKLDSMLKELEKVLEKESRRRGSGGTGEKKKTS